MKTIQLGSSDLHVTPICLGTMTFGEQVDEPISHAILSHAVERGITFWDTAELYAVPPRADTSSMLERILSYVRRVKLGRDDHDGQ
jgi:aryl-alcohol dehydrogenase-like predicted oxidoreductase